MFAGCVLVDKFIIASALDCAADDDDCADDDDDYDRGRTLSSLPSSTTVSTSLLRLFSSSS